ncbi:hypothetical protein TWF481_000557 [Arthrobotrys musiformis]|uniref:F-box domain-containing protein n=1 Tax=Arthrobotrys musiformis TaxID=47236 RepID=A0AAV9WPS1_9PEZI
MRLTVNIADELTQKQRMLKGVWISGCDDGESPGIISTSIFRALNSKFQLQDLHINIAGISDIGHALNIMTSFNGIPNQLQRLSVRLTSAIFLVDSFESPAPFWESHQQEFYPKFKLPFKPQFDWLTHLSLKDASDAIFERTRRIDLIFPLGQLETLRFVKAGELSDTLLHMTGKCHRLKMFALWGGASDVVLCQFVASLPQLEELVLKMRSAPPPNLHDLGIESHGQRLMKLFLKFRDRRANREVGSWFLNLLTRGRTFPKLTELAISCPMEQIHLLRQWGANIPRLKFFWLLNRPIDPKPSLDRVLPHLIPLFRKDESLPKLVFFALGKRAYRKHWPTIYQFCELMAVSGGINTHLKDVTHREMFYCDPGLTLLNALKMWMPCEEERNFIEPMPG